MDKLLILDGNSVLHRAYYALPDWRNRAGEATAGVYGFLSMMLKAIEDLKPTHLAIVFDHPSPTFRHSMYVGYQSNREKERQISEDIWGQIEKLKQVFDLLNLPVYQLSGFEADDVIGTITKKVKCDVIVITGDRDLMQLVNKHVNLYMSFKGFSDMALVDSAKVHERLGIDPDQVIDYKALVGDGSDNYPGVVGIGPKTAIDLLSTYKSFEKVYKNLDKIKESTRKKLVEGYEGGELSQRLATIRTDAPVSFDLEACTIPSKEKILDVLKELGHKSLVARLDKNEVSKVNQVGLFD